MKANPLQKQGKRPVGDPRRPDPVSAQTLRQRYEAATFPLFEYFPVIDAWLVEHALDLWQQIRQEDDELFRLRQLGVPERTYQAKLDAFLRLCEQAERLYYDAQPAELSLPPLAEGERVAVYYELADGSLHKASDEDK
ncbi:MAG: hypothetical protein HYZ72_14300 [Deltaproteobacteria bacterium]|nr:hypothetical protein [Deltaproteobacteria bacterium]